MASFDRRGAGELHTVACILVRNGFSSIHVIFFYFTVIVDCTQNGIIDPSRLGLSPIIRVIAQGLRKVRVGFRASVRASPLAATNDPRNCAIFCAFLGLDFVEGGLVGSSSR